MSKIFRFLVFSIFAGLSLGESLYLGNNNVSCGRYIITETASLDDVNSYCNVLSIMSGKKGGEIVKIQTENSGIIKCKFVNGQLDKCHRND